MDHNEIVKAQQEFWNQRFAEDEYTYGTQPNVFFKAELDKLPVGAAFVPGAGQGRDAVYAAENGWQVSCLDLSSMGRERALQLAAERGVSLSYDVNDINLADYPDESFDVIASIFFHLPSVVRLDFFAKVRRWLKPGGMLLLQAFTPAQLKRSSGGPKDADMLLTSAQLANDLADMEILMNEESETELDEGKYHHGLANVVSFVARKK